MNRVYFAVPTSCPKCVSTLVTDGEYLRCVNTSCPGIIAGNVRKWVTNLEIDFFGMAIIEAMVATGKLKTVADLYRLTEQDIADECGSGNARRAVANLQAKSVIPLHLLFGSLNITNFGRSLAKLLVKAGYDTVDKMLAATITDMAKVEKFGVERATQVWNGLREMESVIRDLEKLVTVQTATPKATGGILAGKSFCITGSLSQPKKVFQDMIESNGGEYLDSVKSGLTYLIAADPTGTSGKLDSARKKGIQVIGEDGLKKLLTGN